MSPRVEVHISYVDGVEVYGRRTGFRDSNKLDAKVLAIMVQVALAQSNGGPVAVRFEDGRSFNVRAKA